LVVTGDLVTFFPRRFARQVAEGLAAFDTANGKYAVLGNHDHWTDPDWIAHTLEASGVHVLRNHVCTLARGEARLHIAGVDDIYEKQHDLNAVLDAIPDDGAAVLLAHEPDFADESAATGRFDLQLSGHSHAGQIRLPGIGALWLPELGEKYPVGLYEIDGMYQYTSRGLGSLTPNVRFWCRPEVTQITLRAASP
ncbi:MAG: metallophosphoesterase, partial [Chloroflexota bacterium]